jgi:hypothetical protein
MEYSGHSACLGIGLLDWGSIGIQRHRGASKREDRQGGPRMVSWCRWCDKAGG